MSGGGAIIEKRPMNVTAGTYPGKPTDVIRYHVIDPRNTDETYVMALPQDDEPQLGDTIWWGGDQTIYFGENDKGRLPKVAYSWSAGRSET